MKIYFNDTEIDVIISDSSYRYQEIMGDNIVALNFSLVNYIDFPIGAYVVIDNNRYTMYDISNFTKINERQYDYNLTFHSPQKELERYKFRNMQDGRLKFTLTAQPQEFLQHIIDNLNQRDSDGGWIAGDCIVSTEKTQTFSHNSIRECLDSVAQLFETEWRIEGKRISLCKTEHGKENPIALSYGRGNGFISGVSQQSGGETAVDVLFVQGGERNIDAQTYTYIKNGQTIHANTLRLPRNYSGWYHPSDNPNDLGTVSNVKISESDMQFITDADGFSVERCDKVNQGYEDSLELTEIYPSHECTCREVTESDPEKHFWDVYDSQNPVDYSAENIISGETMTIIFQSGMLTGKEFDISKYDHATKKFEIVPQDIDGIVMPDRRSGYYPKEGNTFSVFHMKMPAEYINEAEQKLLLNSLHYLYKHSEVEVNFQGTLDGIWSRKNWDDISNRIQLGFYIKFTDNSFAKEGKLLRVVAIKDYINNPHSPELTLSNTSIAAGISSQIKKIAQNQAYAEKINSETLSFAKRNFRDAKETSTMIANYVKNIENYNFSSSINPATINTLQAIFGDANLQFTFGTPSFDSKDTTLVSDWQRISYMPTFKNGVLECKQSYIRHEVYTSSQGIMTTADYKVHYPYWKLGYYRKDALVPDKAYYLYIAAPKSARDNYDHCITDAVFELSDIEKGNTDHNYYLLVGILNSEYGGDRSFAPMWGKTEILPNQILTDRIVSNDGDMYIDLINGVIQGRFNFLSGLISKELYVGPSLEKSQAGIGGPYLLWAGREEGQVPSFYVEDDGSLYIRNKQTGEIIFSVENSNNVNYPVMADIMYIYKLTSPNITADKISLGDNIIMSNSSGIQIKPTINWTGGQLLCRPPMIIWRGKFIFNNNDWEYTKLYAAKTASGEEFSIKNQTFRISEGRAKIVFSEPFNDTNYMITAIGLSDEEGNKPKQAYVCCSSQKKDEIVLTIADDDSLNDYNFEITLWAIE